MPPRLRPTWGGHAHLCLRDTRPRAHRRRDDGQGRV